MTVGQQEIFTVAPGKRLVVPEGWAAWWGVDASTRRVAVAAVDADGTRRGEVVSVEQGPSRSGGRSVRRLAAIYEATRELCSELRRGHAPPGVVVVEQAAGFGKRPNPELAYAVGAVMAALVGALPHTHVETVPSATWKLAVCGFGGIKKPKPTEREEYAVLVWARGVGYEGGSWDLADAYAIAEYGRRTYALEQR